MQLVAHAKPRRACTTRGKKRLTSNNQVNRRADQQRTSLLLSTHTLFGALDIDLGSGGPFGWRGDDVRTRMLFGEMLKCGSDTLCSLLASDCSCAQ